MSGRSRVGLRERRTVGSRLGRWSTLNRRGRRIRLGGVRSSKLGRVLRHRCLCFVRNRRLRKSCTDRLRLGQARVGLLGRQARRGRLRFTRAREKILCGLRRLLALDRRICRLIQGRTRNRRRLGRSGQIRLLGQVGRFSCTCRVASFGGSCRLRLHLRRSRHRNIDGLASRSRRSYD